MEPEALNLDAGLTTACPPVTADAAMEFAARVYGVEGRAEPLSGERDVNFHVFTASGRDHVLKIANPAESRAVLDMQIAALRHLRERDPRLPVAEVTGELAVFDMADGPPCLAWMVAFLPGRLVAAQPVTPGMRRDIGVMLARLARGLGDFSHAAADRALLWDLGQAGRLLPLVQHVADHDLRDHLSRILTRFSETVRPAYDRLPRQVIHADFNSHNLISDGRAITGILDFGDMLRTARVADLAVAASYHVGTDGDPFAPVADIVAGYRTLAPLLPEEARLLPDLIATRLAMTVVISEWRAALYPDNRAYILRNNQLARQRLAAIAATGEP